MASPTVPTPATTAGARLLSLDALRGFDMIWIMGLEEVGAALAKASQAPWAQFFGEQLDHVPWAGFHWLDLVFPMFVFIAGVSTVFSLTKAEREHGKAGALKKLAVRCLILFLLGVFYNGGIAKGIDGIRWLGVLQRISLAGFGGGLAFLLLKPNSRWLLCASLLAGYWALMTFVPVPGFGSGDFAEGHNLANWLDLHFLPGRRHDGTHDPEGLLSTLPAIATCLLGIGAGEWLRAEGRPPLQKAAGLLIAGLVLACAGWLWHLQFPVVKKLWTSSFVLVAGGYSACLLGLFYWMVDVRGWKRWPAPFVWVGMNPITLYLTHGLLAYTTIAKRLAGGPVAAGFGSWAEVWLASCVVGISVLIAWFLHQRRIFLRV